MRGIFLPNTWQHDPALYAPSRYRRSCAYEAFVPDPLDSLPPIAPEVAGTISAAEGAIRQLNAVAQPALQPLARLLLRTESIASSKVEGMQLDARTLARAEARSEVGYSIGREAAEILSNIDAMQLAVDEAAAADALTTDHVRGIHRVLLTGAANVDRVAGIVRRTQNWIGGNDYNPCGADFVPPPPEEVERLLDDLVVFCNDESLPPLAQAALAHAQFETIHPFADGNGRTGRALVQVVLRRRGVAPDYVPPISVVLAADKRRYIEGLVAFRESRENDWLETFSAAAARAAELATAYLMHVQHLQAEWRERLRGIVKREDAAAWLLINELPGHPIISTAIGTALTGRAKPRVQQAIDQLVEAEVLLPLSSGKRNRQWEAIGLLDLLADLEAAEPRQPASPLTGAAPAANVEAEGFALVESKRADGSVRVARRLIREGNELRGRLVRTSQATDAASTSQLPALREEIVAWSEQVIGWSDEEQALTTSQRMRFKLIGSELAADVAAELLASVLDQNIDALTGVVGEGA
jgi:Fic family protein